jgi:hypothetical protein
VRPASRARFHDKMSQNSYNTLALPVMNGRMNGSYSSRKEPTTFRFEIPLLFRCALDSSRGRSAQRLLGLARTVGKQRSCDSLPRCSHHQGGNLEIDGEPGLKKQMTTFNRSCTTFSISRRYGVIYADPPWSFRNWSSKGTGRNAISHYDCLDFDALAALPIADLVPTIPEV